jgi:xanthine dehydrogenase accessory factor
VLTHDPKFDEPALVAAVGHPARYVGAIGSRKTSQDRVERLKAQGLTDEQISRIHAPIGLNIGGRTPEEIALSIAAEIVSVRRGRRADGASSPTAIATGTPSGSAR